MAGEMNPDEPVESDVVRCPFCCHEFSVYPPVGQPNLVLRGGRLEAARDLLALLTEEERAEAFAEFMADEDGEPEGAG